MVPLAQYPAAGAKQDTQADQLDGSPAQSRVFALGKPFKNPTEWAYESGWLRPLRLLRMDHVPNTCRLLSNY